MNFTKKEIRSALFSMAFLFYCVWAVDVGTPVALDMGEAWERVLTHGQ